MSDAEEQRDLGMEDGEGLSLQFDGLLPGLSLGRSVERSLHRVVLAAVGEIQAPVAIVANLARTCARKGYRTLLVDANLSEPSQHQLFGADNQRGLSNLLATTEPPNRLCQQTRIANLALITAGPVPGNAASLLSSEQVFHRVDPLARNFDYVIVDATKLSPLLVATVSESADSIVILTKRHDTSLRELSSFLDALRARGTAEPSVVIVDS